MRRSLASLAGRGLRFLITMMVPLGKIWCYIPDPPQELIMGPAPRHPERVRSDVPLSPLERELARQLRQPDPPDEHRPHRPPSGSTH
uniref:Uncharacterized protein n=1 Tax=Streptomyces versipellis TaxID=67375 RepID=A0A0B6VLR8_9ACTN|nr:hypothetical protein [Streptomyces versipellis]